MNYTSGALIADTSSKQIQGNATLSKKSPVSSSFDYPRKLGDRLGD